MAEKFCTIHETRYERQGEEWVQTSELTEEVDERFYNNVVGAIQVFREVFCGTEIPEYGDTPKGRRVVKLTSLSPNEVYKTVRHFNFWK